MARRERSIARAAPFFALVPPLLLLAILPLVSPMAAGAVLTVSHWQVVAVVAIAPLAAVAPLWAGWHSGEHLALVGGVRAAILHLCYAPCLALALAAIVLRSGVQELDLIVVAQLQSSGLLSGWNIALQPLGAVAFIGWLLAWSERAPFAFSADSAPLAGGYRRHFCGGDLALLRLADHARLFAGAALGITLYGGGWHLPGWAAMIEGNSWRGMGEVVALMAKSIALVWVLAWCRRALPQLDSAQSLRLLCLLLLPLALINLLWVAAVFLFFDGV
jgi:NADH:ubiquinone oxidoreductase subunit H